jgi:hypothetical protein
MAFNKKLIYCFNVSKDIEGFKHDLISECESQRKMNKTGKIINHNFLVVSKYINKLYNIFYIYSQNILNKFTLKDIDFTLWCFMTDRNYFKTGWHNHKNTATINCVIYLETQNQGIDFKEGEETLYLEPHNGDMLIFPNFLDHYPHVSKQDKRISLNLEMRCNENAKEIFNV